MSLCESFDFNVPIPSFIIYIAIPVIDSMEGLPLTDAVWDTDEERPSHGPWQLPS